LAWKACKHLTSKNAPNHRWIAYPALVWSRVIGMEGLQTPDIKERAKPSLDSVIGTGLLT
jgi:hypothetical protein